jgi:hypothetical protein
MAHLPRVLRAARALSLAYQGSAAERELNALNGGMRTPRNPDMIDALRGSTRIAGDIGAQIEALERAARNSPRRRG